MLMLFVAMERLIGWPAGRGITTITIAHVTFSMAYVTVIIQSRLANFDDSLDGFSRNHTALIWFGAILALCAIVWFAASAVMLSTVFHITAPDMQETLYRGFLDSMNRSQVEAYVAVGGALAAFVFMLSVVTVPVIIDQHATAGQAVLASVKAVFTNIPAMILWSALILALTIIGYAPFFGGLLIVSPLLGHATWHAYRDLIR